MARICSTVKFTCKEKHCYIRIKAEMKDLDVSMEHRGRHGIVTAHVRVFSGFANTTSVAQHLTMSQVLLILAKAIQLVLL